MDRRTSVKWTTRTMPPPPISVGWTPTRSKRCLSTWATTTIASVDSLTVMTHRQRAREAVLHVDPAEWPAISDDPQAEGEGGGITCTPSWVSRYQWWPTGGRRGRWYHLHTKLSFQGTVTMRCMAEAGAGVDAEWAKSTCTVIDSTKWRHDVDSISVDVKQAAVKQTEQWHRSETEEGGA